MILFKDKLLSEAIFEEHFVCDLSACKGKCCVEGDTGAPLEPFELAELEGVLDAVRPYLSKAHQDVLDAQGPYALDDEDGVFKTSLHESKHCVCAIEKGGVTLCGIEEAYNDNKVTFRKPISCHLYPIRITKLNDTEALNYEEWEICKAACALGEQLKTPVYAFVKDALVRKYGEAFFEELEQLAEYLNREKS